MPSPFPPNAAIKWGRIDQGIDGSSPPNTPAAALGDGTVQILHDPSGFGINYAVLSLANPVSVNGHTYNAIYYGHLFPTVGNGPVKAGQQIAVSGEHGGGNATSEVGGFELGFWCSGPCPNAGNDASDFFKGGGGTVSTGGGTANSPGLSDLLNAMVNAGKWLTDTHNLKRALMVFVGALAFIVGFHYLLREWGKVKA